MAESLTSASWSISQDTSISRIIIFRMKLNSQISIDNFKNQYMPSSVMSSCHAQVWILPGEQHSGKVYFHFHCLQFCIYNTLNLLFPNTSVIGVKWIWAQLLARSLKGR